MQATEEPQVTMDVEDAASTNESQAQSIEIDGEEINASFLPIISPDSEMSVTDISIQNVSSPFVHRNKKKKRASSTDRLVNLILEKHELKKKIVEEQDTKENNIMHENRKLNNKNIELKFLVKDKEKDIKILEEKVQLLENKLEEERIIHKNEQELLKELIKAKDIALESLKYDVKNY